MGGACSRKREQTEQETEEAQRGSSGRLSRSISLRWPVKPATTLEAEVSLKHGLLSSPSLLELAIRELCQVQLWYPSWKETCIRFWSTPDQPEDLANATHLHKQTFLQCLSVLGIESCIDLGLFEDSGTCDDSRRCNYVHRCAHVGHWWTAMCIVTWQESVECLSYQRATHYWRENEYEGDTLRSYLDEILVAGHWKIQVPVWTSPRLDSASTQWTCEAAASIALHLTRIFGLFYTGTVSLPSWLSFIMNWCHKGVGTSIEECCVEMKEDLRMSNSVANVLIVAEEPTLLFLQN